MLRTTIPSLGDLKYCSVTVYAYAVLSICDEDVIPLAAYENFLYPFHDSPALGVHSLGQKMGFDTQRAASHTADRICKVTSWFRAGA